MTDRERELLACLIEECAEVQKDGCKALRFGLDEGHPDAIENNRQAIAHELGDLLCVMDMLVEGGVLDADLVASSRMAKRDKLLRLLRSKE